MEAGEHWMLNEVTGKPIRAWNSRLYAFRFEYDTLRRPLQSFVQGGDPSDPSGEVFAQEILFEQTVYGDSPDTGLTASQQQQANLLGRVFRRSDSAGVLSTSLYDFKGNSLTAARQFTADYKNAPDWSQTPALETEVFTSASQYDALNRAIAMTAPDGSVLERTFNRTGLLETVAVDLQGTQQNGQPVWTPFVSNIEYDAKGQRSQIDYGNAVTTTYLYDPETFRLTNLVTSRSASSFPGDCPQPPVAGWPGCQAQNLVFTYDPIGNITTIRDNAQQTIYFQNQRVDPSNDYTYDPLYRLIEATGREHLGQGGAPAPLSYNDSSRVGILLSGSDGNAMGRYLQSYLYDPVGNLLQMVHGGTSPVNTGWTRSYLYAEPSLLDPGQVNNRLTSNTVGTVTEIYSTGGNGYDAHGNLLQMPQLNIMQWNFRDQLKNTQRQAVNGSDQDGLQHQGERTYYVYDSTGQRVRKVTERQAAAGQTPTRMKERVYLGDFEVYREYGADGATVTLERQSLHVMDNRERIALVETRTKGNDGSPAQLVRYQFTNQLGSAIVELDDAAQVITYEEYFPYGSTSYQTVRSQTETPKRYRYTGMERDEESGLNYHAKRYYATWLGRWTAADPIGIGKEVNLFGYSMQNPINKVDPDGSDPIGVGTCKREDPLTITVAVKNFEYVEPTTYICDDLGMCTPISTAERDAIAYDQQHPATLHKLRVFAQERCFFGIPGGVRPSANRART